MAGAMEIDSPGYDDMTIGLQMQQFMDEWSYRVLHSGLAYTVDRTEIVCVALEAIEMLGLRFTPEEKVCLAEMEDESEMIQEVVRRMPLDIRKQFEHFTLQLQLVVSSATRVRHALEEGDPKEAAKVMDEGDTGISQQILRQAILEAANEIGELNRLMSTYDKNMSERVARLVRCGDEAVAAASQLAALNATIQNFPGEQSQKTKAVLASMTQGHDKTLMETVWKSWLGMYVMYKAEQDIHDKFKIEIEEAQLKLLNLKASNKSGMKSILLKKAQDSDAFVKQDVIGTWKHITEAAREDREMATQIEQANAKLAAFKDSQTANTKKVMMRMSAGTDKNLITITFQGWARYSQAIAASLEGEKKLQEAGAQLAEQMAKASESAKGVISRMLGGSDQGAIMMTRGAWMELWKADKAEREADEALNRATTKYADMSARQKRVMKNVADRNNEREEELVLMSVFCNWATRAKAERVISYFSGKLAQKDQQLDTVQGMFKNLSSQLGKEISNSPRSTAAVKSRRGGSSDA